MSTKSKSDISNSAIRMLLQSVGSFYDESRGFRKFNKNGSEWMRVVKYFYGKCCYCGLKLDEDNATDDHLIPINRTALGLHAWGNIVPCCRRCNKEKHFNDWVGFMKSKCSTGVEFDKKTAKIRQFQEIWKYNPGLELQEIAHNLYEDVGEVSSALINLRLKQARAVISQSLGVSDGKSE